MSRTLSMKNPDLWQMYNEFNADSSLKNNAIYRTPPKTEEDTRVTSHAPQVAYNKENDCQRIDKDVLISIPPLPTSPELDVPTWMGESGTPQNSVLFPNFNLRFGAGKREPPTVHSARKPLSSPQTNCNSCNFHSTTGAEHLCLFDLEEDPSPSQREFHLVPKSFDFENHFFLATSSYED